MLIYYIFLLKDALAQHAFHALYVDLISNDFQINEGHINSCGHLFKCYFTDIFACVRFAVM